MSNCTYHIKASTREKFEEILQSLIDSQDPALCCANIEWEKAEPGYYLNCIGKQRAKEYIRECEAKRKEVLDAGKDTANDTMLPTLEVIEEDINFLGLDDQGEYCNGWGVTDHYDADYPLLLKLYRDIEEVA
ncbi:MAG: hypothetical protein K6E19_10175 [Lachnospiraceae bacterium]|nr:hypothetical protein [Lachnospiraceae bacterium]